ncbi:hypothetical protein GALMADRAFT_258513 [Galerina marginata CBS 339.88]|uniref:Uncharacterized protein n=1 Tax=Galerina marginata (strain CBS 339.88) TaxID=685588 RepID=A0A067S8G5_GALM3|nr:hypothetical protein GALMADRAFT_258513 [Galerina marginata CBS 339.88]
MTTTPQLCSGPLLWPFLLDSATVARLDVHLSDGTLGLSSEPKILTEAHVSDQPTRSVEYANARPHGLLEVSELWPFARMKPWPVIDQGYILGFSFP